MTSHLSYLASAGINIIIVILYRRFLLEHNGFSGIITIYAVAFGLSIAVYLFRNKNLIVELVMSVMLFAFIIYSLVYAKSYQLLAEIIMTTFVVFSITSFYFDWDHFGKQRRCGLPAPKFFGFDLARLGKSNKNNFK